MSQAATPVTRLCAAALVAGAALIPALPAAAAPVLTSPDPAVALGIRASWVDVDSSPHTIQQALDATNGVGYTINQTINQVLSFIEEQAIISKHGKKIPTRIHTFCAHGDEPTGVAVAGAVRAALEARGIQVVALTEMQF